MEFEITPGAKVTTNRNLALISLHHDFTNYLTLLNEKVRPTELPLMVLHEDLNFKDYSLERGMKKGKSYLLYPSCEGQIRDFANEFKKEYPEIEQVYVFSKWSGSPKDSRINSEYYRTPVSNYLGRILNDIILKRFLILDFMYIKKEEYCYSSGYEPRASSNEEIKKTIERSLRFNSW